jgi:lipopolysaccharide/colanic/teichoic acid biosynthesis glycosyltransferase
MTTTTATSSALQALAHVASRKAHNEVLQRQLNQLAAALLLLIFSPLMLAVALLIIRRDGAPVFFGHYRVGLQGRLFRCYKFRTMYTNSAAMLSELLQNDPAAHAEWERDHKLSQDPRVTPVGRFLRRTSLDELPQLFNVLRGEMALVGPRPITVGELSRYGRVRWNYLSVLPGMTGLWQVSGRSSTTYDERVALDRDYVNRRSLGLDVSILLRTVRVVMVREGAH